MILNGSQIFVEVLAEQGVDTIFGHPGGAVLNLYDELYKNSDRIRHILTAHEQGASHAADGYARATGRTGVVLATSGPGAANLVTGIATAYMDSVPMVAFTGNVATSLLGRDSFQEAYIEGITMPITSATSPCAGSKTWPTPCGQPSALHSPAVRAPCWWIFPRMSPRTPASSPTKSRS